MQSGMPMIPVWDLFFNELRAGHQITLLRIPDNPAVLVLYVASGAL